MALDEETRRGGCCPSTPDCQASCYGLSRSHRHTPAHSGGYVRVLDTPNLHKYRHLPGVDNVHSRRDPRLGLSQISWRTSVAHHPPEDKTTLFGLLQLSLQLQGRACGTPAPGLSPATAQRARAAGREGKRNLRRAAPPGRWRRREGGELPAPGASAKAAPFSVRTLPGAAADARRPTPLPPGRW